jgi:hypothetical protein
MKKVAVIGTGTNGITSLAHLLAWLPPDEWQVVSIYDPKIPMLGIGETATSSVPQALFYGAGLNFFTDTDELDVTIKQGTKYTNWRDKEHMAVFPVPNYGIHFNNFKLKDVCFPRFKKKWGNKFVSIEGTLSDIQNLPDKVTCKVDDVEYEFDYIVDCGGYPTNYDEDYITVDTIPVNHALINMVQTPGDWNYTHHWAHPNGWMFGIPLKTRQGWGYLYNDKITSKEEAIKNFSEIRGIPADKLITNEFAFKNYKAKKFIDNRIVKNGNKALFFEPIEALAGWFYDQILRTWFDYAVINKFTEEQANANLHDFAVDHELAICYIYHGGSTFDSEFWKTTVEKCSKKLATSDKWKFNLEVLKKVKPELYASAPAIYPFPYAVWNHFDEGLGYNYFSTK